MKRLLLAGLLATGLAPAAARAQANGGAPTAAMSASRGPDFPRKRTLLNQLPLEGQAEILRLETLLEQAHAAFAAGPGTAVFPYWRAEAVEQAGHQAAAVVPTWDQKAYQQEAAFYAAEEARRHPPTSTP